MGDKIEFTPELAERFTRFLQQTGEVAIRKYLAKFKTEKQDENTKDDARLLFHALYCLYERKVLKQEDMPKKQETRMVRFTFLCAVWTTSR